jgi:HAD superfamily hydrolase (TIGR01509 family)
MEVLTTFPTLEALQRGHEGLRAVLFDMDGTLFRTEEAHGEALREMASAWGLAPPFPPEEVEARLKGLADEQVWQLARTWPGFPPGLTTHDFVAEKNRRLLALIPGLAVSDWTSPQLHSLLRAARRSGMATGLVTSSERVVTDLLLKVAGVRELFDLVITLQDVDFPKPHPFPYLKAMIQLGVGPRETVIFEDSPTGLQAARACGARFIKADWW